MSDYPPGGWTRLYFVVFCLLLAGFIIGADPDILSVLIGVTLGAIAGRELGRVIRGR